DYYLTSGGIDPVAVGTDITSSQTVYVYSANGSCAAENSFYVDITTTPLVDAPADVSACDVYTLPALTNGDYYSVTGGVGPIAVGTDILADQTIYVYAANGSCTAENSFYVDITTTPLVDAPADVSACDSYILPALTDGEYFETTGGIDPLPVGYEVTSDMTIYVYAADGSCTAENSFFVDITTTPLVDAPADVSACDVYTLPALTNGDYYSATGGVGPIAAGTDILSDQTIYVYAANGSCSAENSFYVDITTTPLVDAPADVSVCDVYTLPPLTNGDYFSATGGVGPIPVGTDILADQTIYVYAADGSCTAENSFFVDITTTPLVDAPADVSVCDVYTLPALTNGDYYSATGGVGPIAAGTDILSDQTIYVYAANGSCTAENSFFVDITTTPLVDAPADVSACDVYTLPALTNGDYYLTSGGIDPVAVGTDITSSQTVYVYSANGSCTAENSFYISVHESPTIVVNVTSASGEFASDGAAEAVVTGGTEPYTIIWSTLNEGETLTGLTPGNYSVEVFDANGCTDAEDFIVDWVDIIVDNEIVYSIYPNPTDHIVYIETESNLCDQIQIIDILGQVVYSYQPVISKTSIDLSHYQPGVYFVKLYVGDKEFTQKLVVK
ncbi:MAG: hypothetical protein C0596_08515, partial [Marinilabiliales bacterium]